MTACQSTKTVANNGGKSTKQVSKAEKKPWYETSKTFLKQQNDFEATGTAVSLDSTRAITKARHTSVAILQSQLQEILEGLRTGMVKNGVKVAKEPLYILKTRTCLNNLYDQLNPDKVAIQAHGNGYKAYVKMHITRTQVWDNWKESLSTSNDFAEATDGNPIIRSWLHPEAKDTTSTSGK